MHIIMQSHIYLEPAVFDIYSQLRHSELLTLSEGCLITYQYESLHSMITVHGARMNASMYTISNKTLLVGRLGTTYLTTRSTIPTWTPHSSIVCMASTEIRRNVGTGVTIQYASFTSGALNSGEKNWTDSFTKISIIECSSSCKWWPVANACYLSYSSFKSIIIFMYLPKDSYPSWRHTTWASR